MRFLCVWRLAATFWRCGERKVYYSTVACWQSSEQVMYSGNLECFTNAVFASGRSPLSLEDD